MIPAPKLDDRTYADIVAEAMRLIPRYCPEWTNHNPSDPGITMLELTAWMTELILYRLNRVPEKNYLAFLDLIGVRLRSPQPAHALITFDLVDGADRQTIRQGTQIATPQAADEDTVVFETQRELLVTGVKLDRCFSYFDETYADNSPFILGSRPEGFEAFAGADRIERFLYLGDMRFSSLNEATVLRVHVNAPETGGRDLARLLEWEYWNGRRWRDLRVTEFEVERGEVVFFGPGDIQPTTVHGLEDTWIRGRLAEVPQSPHETEVDTVRAVIETIGEGQPPDAALANLDNNVFIALDLGKNSYPFGNEPKVDHCFYIASRELLSQADAEVRIEIALSDPTFIAPPTPSEDLLVSWEYFDEKKWRILGKSTPKGVVKTQEAVNEWNFRDDTRAFTRSGVISFNVPKDIKAGDVNGEDNFWVRARIETGDYGTAGSYMLDGDKWVWRDERPLHPPGLKAIAFKYRSDLHYVKHVLSYNDFRFRDHSDESKLEYRPFQPFSVVPDEGAALYLGFDNKLPNETISLYFQMLENLGPRDQDFTNMQYLRSFYERRDAVWEAEQKVVWEFWDDKTWAPLPVVDDTRNFTRSGFVDFVGPDTHAKSLKFTEDRFWIRARLEMGGYVKPPTVVRILQNTVQSANVVTIRNEVLGSSDGTPIQVFKMIHGAYLEGEVIEVRERDQPPAEDVADLGAGAFRTAEVDQGGGFWVRWRAVDSFFESGPRSRHYLRAPTTGEIHFGDGSKGMMPPEGRANVVARRYQIGGGVRGNVNSNTLTALTRSIAYIDKVTNHLAAAGGSDAETIEEAKTRAPMEIKSRDRAVTAEDFESLALRASTGIARAKCLPSGQHDGHVLLVVVPKADEKNQDLTRRLEPAPELLRHVANFVDERRLVSTVLEVVKPVYIEVSIKVTLIRRTVGQADRVRREIEERLRRYLHPLVGGRDGKGWPFGRSVYKSDLAHIVEDIPGVEVIDSITIYDEDKRFAVDNVRLRPEELIHLVNVAVVERVREEIVMIQQHQRALIKMPEVVGLPLRKAMLLVENAGLTVDAVLYQESYDDRNTVLDQKPLRGQMIYVGERVVLTVSRESYMKWLPSIFQRSDVTGRNFLRDFLWITQHLFGTIEEQLDVVHTFFDPHETPDEFLPWLAGWTAMVLEEDWPLPKKRKLIKKAVELYKIRGTVKGVKLFISLFTDHEPDIVENAWPFRGFQIGVTSGIGVDSVILSPVNLSHTFLVEMPMTYQDVSIESVIRLHEIIQMEKPANTSYYLRFLAEQRSKELRGFYEIGIRSGVGIGQEVLVPLPAGGMVEDEQDATRTIEMRPADMPHEAGVDEFIPPTRGKPPLPKAPKADNAPIEGQEVRTNLAGGFDQGARQMEAVSLDDALEGPLPTQQMDKPQTGMLPPQKTGTVPAQKTGAVPSQKTTETKKTGDDPEEGGKGPTKKKPTKK